MSGSFTVVDVDQAPSNLAVNVLELGNKGSAGTFIDTGPLTFSGGNVSFGGGTSSGDSGVYDGTISGITESPSTGNYLAAEPNGPVTISFSQPQEYFSIIWGSVDNYNSLVFTLVGGGTYTITGSQIEAAASGSDSKYVTVTIPGGYTEVQAYSTTAAFEFADVSYADTTTPAAGSAIPVAVDPNPDSICLLEGTGIATPEGRRLIETLRIGDLVTLSDGRRAPIRWIGRQTVAMRFADPLRNLPIRICANALGEALPERDLLVSPDHALAIDGVLIHASALVNNVTILRENDMPEMFIYYNIELAAHELILAENVPVETFIDNVDRRPFDNWAEYEAQHGRPEAIVEMDLPRAKSARQVPREISARLAARAGITDGDSVRAA
jgi:hypothetical protein